MTELTPPVEIQHSNAYLIVICGLLVALLVMEVVNAIGNVHDVMASRNVMYHMYREQAAMLGQEYHDQTGGAAADHNDLYHLSNHNHQEMLLVASDEELHQRRRLRKQRERERRAEIDAALLSKKVVVPPLSKSSIVARSKRRLSDITLFLSCDDNDDDGDDDTKSSKQGNRNSTNRNDNESNHDNSSRMTAVKNESSEEDDLSMYKEEMSKCEQAAANFSNNQISNGMNNVQQQLKQNKSESINQQCHPIPIFERRKSNIYVTLTEGAARRSSQRYSLSQTLRLCPDVCHICLGEYKLGEDICWSRNPTCIHAFHRDCIVEWLLMSNTYFSGDGSTTSQDNEKQHNEHDGCPCCRQSYFDFST